MELDIVSRVSAIGQTGGNAWQTGNAAKRLP